VNIARLAGRTRIIAAIREEMAANYHVENLRLHNLLERRGVGGVWGAIASAIQSTLSGSLPSLQCLLFCDRANHKRLVQELRSDPPEILYLDGVRTFYFLRYLNGLKLPMRVVVDLDDLMSRRMESLGSTGTSLSLGYLEEKIPAALRDAIASGSISKRVARYEQRALARVESLMGQWADAVTLLSPVEGDLLQASYRELGCKAEVHVIPPAVDVIAPPQAYATFSRFIFIGTDTLPQNKLTIQRILDLWRSNQPEAEIHVFGHMTSRWPTVSGVVFRDYVPSLADVYIEGAVLLAPGVLRGGIKTKVSEAFANGCAVIGNDITFEGFRLDDYPLLTSSDEELNNVIAAPASYLDRMRRAAVLGQDYVRSFLSPEQFRKNWNDVLG
jgi:glycosyltransferase involved in cell wall biosynthesis